MFTALIPLFDENLSVCAYSLFAQKDNKLMHPALLGSGYNDGAGTVIGFDIINHIGAEAMSEGKSIFVSVNNISIFSDIIAACRIKPEKIILLMDKSVLPEVQYVERIKQLKDQGFKLCMRKLDVYDFEPYKPILQLVDYMILDHKKIANIESAKIYFGKVYPNIKLIAGNIDTMEIFEDVVEKGGYSYYEGNF